VPADWKLATADIPTQKIWAKGDPNEPDAVFSVTSSDINEILGGLKVESKKATTVGGKSALVYAGSLIEESGKGIVIVFDEKAQGSKALALIGFFHNDAAWNRYKVDFDRIVDSIKFAGAAAPGCKWDSFTNDLRQFVAQPGRVLPLRRNYKAGKYLVHVGPAGKDGLSVPPAKWRTFGPYDIAAGNKYCGLIRSGAGTLCELQWEQNSARLETYSKPPAGSPGLEGYAVVYVRNDALDQWYAICLERVGDAPTAPGCTWDSFTNDPRQFATQPGGVLPLRKTFGKGRYSIHVGPAGNNGLNIPPAIWNTFGPFDIEGGNKYAAIIKKGQGAGCDLIWEKNSARLTMYSTPPPTAAVVYVRNDALDQWYAICLEQLAETGGEPVLDFDASVLQNIKTGQTYTFKAKASHIPPEVKKLKFSWYLHMSECVSAIPAGSKVNFWYNQIVDVRNGEAEAVMVMKAESQKREAAFDLFVRDEPYTKKVFLSVKHTTYQIK
jgi:hypothetical protein